jgi:hypothetical protein
MKKIAVIVSGWHFSLHFYREMARQKIPKGWSVDLFCVSHRDPHYSLDEKKEFLGNLGWSYPETLDKVLYENVASIEDLEQLGWNYKLYPNTVGDFGNTNQWLEEHDYKQYDVLLISHDDNLILTDRLFTDLVAEPSDWIILTNSSALTTWKEFVKVKILGRPINVRGSFEFIKSELFDRLGGKFDISEVHLTRENEFSSPSSFKALNNWNMVLAPLRRFLQEQGLAARVKSLSNTYRVSKYCVEGERGFISSVQPANKQQVKRGLQHVQKLYGTFAKNQWK